MDFRSKPLGMLDKLFRFVGGKAAPSSIDLENPIQPVLDVSRLAQLGSGQGPFFGTIYGGIYQDISGADADSSNEDPYAIVTAMNLPGVGRDFWIYLTGASVWTNSDEASKVDKASISIRLKKDSIPFLTPSYDPPVPVFLFEAGTDPVVPFEYEGGIGQPFKEALGNRLNPPFPYLIPYGGYLSYCWDCSAAMTAPGIIFIPRYWIGSPGTTPPGWP